MVGRLTFNNVTNPSYEEYVYASFFSSTTKQNGKQINNNLKNTLKHSNHYEQLKVHQKVGVQDC